MKIYYLSSCSTCKRILADIPKDKVTHFQDIKTSPLTEEQLEEMAELAGSYESLFSKRSQKYRPMGLDKKQLSEKEIKELILQEYTFLKRPVIVDDGEIFIGSEASNIQRLKDHFTK